MFNFPKYAALALSLVLATQLSAQTRPAMAAMAGMAGIGREATADEVNAWNIDVRADFKGLPKGKGTVAQGEKLWEEKCASCHGAFGDSNSVFNPLIGGTKKSDVATGHVASLRGEYPGRTMIMKIASVSTIWDYIRRAMPWTSPKSLKVDEVYALTAYLMNMAEVVPADFTLSNDNIAEVQAKLPNRHGMSTNHAMWPGNDFKGKAKPDVQGSRCMKDCAPEPKITSRIPDFARNAHGNLADQNRLVGEQRGVVTDTSTNQIVNNNVHQSGDTKESIQKLLSANTCTACHSVDQKIVGPSFKEVAAKYQGKADAVAYLAGKIRTGGSGVWGQIPMPPHTLSDADVSAIARWVLTQN
jgi:S-disulfanyl-L-cysteine oxidoreductase SoxD